MVAKHEIPAVLSALNLNALGVARTLGRHGVPVVVVGGDGDVPEAHSKHFRTLWRAPHDPDALVPTLLSRVGELGGKPVLFPITDASVEAIAAHAGEISARYRLGMGDPAMVARLLDKRSFHKLAQELDFPVPVSFDATSKAELEDVAQKLRFPCIMKPQVKSEAYASTGAKKAYVVDDAATLLSTYAQFAQVEPRVMVQEYIPGGDDEVYFCLQYYDAKSQALASFTGRKLRQWPPHCGGTAVCEPFPSSELEALTTRFFQAVHFQGLCSMEYKRDPRTGRHYLIEPTVCRTDWQSAVADLNGVPIPYVAYCDLIGEAVPFEVRQGDSRRKWVHLEADRLSASQQVEGGLDTLTWLWSLRPPLNEAYVSLEDPGPALSIIAKKVATKVQEVLPEAADAIRMVASRSSAEQVAVPDPRPVSEERRQASRARVRDWLRRLVPLSYRGLEKMLLPDGLAYCFRALKSGEQELRNDDRSDRYTTMVLLGLDLQEKAGQPIPKGLMSDKMWNHQVEWALSSADPGDQGLVLWALAQRGDDRAVQVARRILAERTSVLAERASFASMDMGWLVAGLVAAHRVGIGGSELADVTALVADKLLANQDQTTGLFRFTRPVPRKDINATREHSNLGSFASQVYPTIALSGFGHAFKSVRHLDAAEKCARAITALQGPEGQWWWVYQVKSAKPAVKYPVYGVHQDAMGPMALLALELAGRPDARYDLAIERSFDWLEHHPELPSEPLIDEGRGIIWRAIQLDDPATTGRLGLGKGELRRMAAAAWLGSSDDRPYEGGFVCPECRPYHLGWLLLADGMQRLAWR